MGRIGEDLWKKNEKNAKIKNFWAKSRRVYRYRLSCTGIGVQ